MKVIIVLFTIFLMLALTISDALAQSQAKVITDTVIKNKEDDDGKLFVLSQAKPIFYLKHNNPNFDSILVTMVNSQTFQSPVKITTDSQFNIVKAE